jgi:hypothetical protein
MSSFAVSTTTVVFTIDRQGFMEHKANLLRTWDMTLLLASATDCATPYADIAGGAGKGTLTVDNASDSPYTAALVRIDRPSAYPGGARRVTASFQEVP